MQVVKLLWAHQRESLNQTEYWRTKKSRLKRGVILKFITKKRLFFDFKIQFLGNIKICLIVTIQYL